jgi:hypothetical protein
MTNTHCDALQLYQKVLSPRRVGSLVRQLRCRAWAPLYKLNVVLWLMISEHLQSAGTLAQSVARVARGELGSLVRKRQRCRMSLRTGGYCRARQRMPLKVMRAVLHFLTEQLHKLLSQPEPGLGRPIYIADGSSLRLPHTREFAKKYPPAINQHGQAHWPVVKIAVLHEGRTGLATEIVHGPMFGAEAVSEQALLERLFDDLPPGALVIADRNFGIFATAFALRERRCDVLLRLTQERTRVLLQGRLEVGADEYIVWKPSRWDRRHHPELPETAEVRGRVLVCAVGGLRQPFYFFTTVEVPAAEVLRLYGLRWNVETDLKALKQTIRLQPLRVKSEDMIEKELLAAVAAYNLVRTVMCLAAQQAQVHPRELSFTNVLYLVRPFSAELWSDPDLPKGRKELRRLIRAAGTCKLPKRPHARSFPREIWAQGYRYPEKPAIKCK